MAARPRVGKRRAMSDTEPPYAVGRKIEQADQRAALDLRIDAGSPASRARSCPLQRTSRAIHIALYSDKAASDRDLVHIVPAASGERSCELFGLTARELELACSHIDTQLYARSPNHETFSSFKRLAPFPTRSPLQVSRTPLTSNSRRSRGTHAFRNL